MVDADLKPSDSGPLAGIRVIDLAIGPMAAVGRQLSELGAQVIRIEPRAGGADRQTGAMVDGVSLDFIAANRGKTFLALDLGLAADQAQFEGLLAGADIAICTAALDGAALAERHPSLVVLDISDFGHGDFADWQATEPVLLALSGVLAQSGLPGSPPLLPPAGIAFGCAATQAAFVVLLAYLNRLQTGQGDYLDFTLMDGVSQALDPGFGISGSATAGVPAHKMPRGRPNGAFRYPIIACADGYVRLCVMSPRQWQGLFAWMGSPAEFADPAFNSLTARYQSPTLIPAMAAFFAGQRRADLERDGQAHGVAIAGLLDLNEVMASDQIAARQAMVRETVAPGITTCFPNGMLEIDGQRAVAAQACGPPFWQARADEKSGSEARATSARPLAGLRVLDLGVIVVGAEQGRLLADQGAEVWKVETAAFPDGTRQTRDGAIMSPTFAAGHRNKKGLGVNLRDPQGQAVFLKLVESTDIVLSNFKPGTLESLGLSYERLSQINPRLIMVDSSGFGDSGPWSRRLGYGPLVRAVAGLTDLWRYPDDPEGFSDTVTVYPDHVAGRMGVIGALALLIRRRRTGRGGTVSVSQMEVMLGHMAGRIAVAGLEPPATPAQTPDCGPWGVFPCAGDDDWCVVTVTTEAQLKALNQVLGGLDLTAWLAGRTAQEAMTSLQSAGVPAGAMQRVIDLPAFAYFKERHAYRHFQQAHIADPVLVENAPVRSRRLADPPLASAPLPGEHTREIIRDVLRLSDDEINLLIAGGALEATEGATLDP